LVGDPLASPRRRRDATGGWRKNRPPTQHRPRRRRGGDRLQSSGL